MSGYSTACARRLSSTTPRSELSLPPIWVLKPRAKPSGGAAYGQPQTNNLAVASMICGIVQFFGFWLLGTIPAIVLGHMARKQIRQRNEQGAGMALAGLILGYVGVALTVIVVIIIVIAVNSCSRSGTCGS